MANMVMLLASSFAICVIASAHPASSPSLRGSSSSRQEVPVVEASNSSFLELAQGKKPVAAGTVKFENTIQVAALKKHKVKASVDDDDEDSEEEEAEEEEPFIPGSETEDVFGTTITETTTATTVTTTSVTTITKTTSTSTTVTTETTTVTTMTTTSSTSTDDDPDDGDDEDDDDDEARSKRDHDDNDEEDDDDDNGTPLFGRGDEDLDDDSDKKQQEQAKAVPAACQSPKPVVFGMCADKNAMCGCWAAKGECSKNVAYMTAACKASCGQCPKVESHKEEATVVSQPAESSTMKAPPKSKAASEGPTTAPSVASPVAPTAAAKPESLPAGPTPSSSAYGALRGNFCVFMIISLLMLGC